MKPVALRTPSVNDTLQVIRWVQVFEWQCLMQPPIAELSELFDAADWSWSRESLGASRTTRRSFWIGTDPSGQRWLVKLRGSFAAYRERVFGSLAQMLSLSCQTSAFLMLPDDADPIKADPTRERCQGAIWLLQEHQGCDLSPCPISTCFELFAAESNWVAALGRCALKHAVDEARACILAYLCGANEPSDVLITADHQVVIIDNEFMFSSGPTIGELLRDSRLLQPDGAMWEEARSLTRDLCERFAELTDGELDRCLAVPDGYIAVQSWPIRPLLERGRIAARRVVALTA